MKKTTRFIAVLLSMALLTACASVGVRTVGHQPITIIIGAPTPTPTPLVVKEVK